MRDRKAELDALGAAVLLITFAPAPWPERWLEETGAPFPLLLDPDRAVYRAYGLRRDIWNCWHPRMFWIYFKLMLKGRKLRGIQGDPYQLGGDFVIGPDGIVRLARPSRDPGDRPGVDELVAALKRG